MKGGVVVALGIIVKRDSEMSDAGHVTVVVIYVEYKNRLALLLIQHRNITKTRKFEYNLSRLL